jgi:predicted HD phosphohydrolase
MDDQHQTAVLPHLQALFGPRVLRAIAGHVNAKRYLCATDAGYREHLSADSVRSLALQGGVFSAQQAQAFIAAPGAAEAVQLRRWDDEAKAAGLATPDLAHFLARAQRCLRTVPH